MLFISIALVICVGLIVWRGVNFSVKVHYNYPESEKPDETADMYDSDGDIKADFRGKEQEMREFLQDINSFMVGNDMEIEEDE